MPGSDLTPAERTAAETLVRLALAEDLGDRGDVTGQALIGAEERAMAAVTARQEGVLAGIPIAKLVVQHVHPDLEWSDRLHDGEAVSPGDIVAEISGPLAPMLVAERTLLNFLTHLSGIASLTRKFVDAVKETRAQILDTRKTLPGWRLLQKYAVRCGGGVNHRIGLYDGVLIKDNHLAAWTESHTIAEAVQTAKSRWHDLIIEVEVDTLDQLRDALRGKPDMVLLDNLPPRALAEAVAVRDAAAPQTLLEASGGVNLATVRQIAETGVDRISIGALTHSAPALDLALDWEHRQAQAAR
ncbi:MAG: carboxylating nicotinate-nucleotide diphosphorylase [Planctomycetaceae bacterium]